MANARTLPVAETQIEALFRELTLLMYDTSVPLSTLSERVNPYLSPDIVFVDPWVHVRGRRRFEIGLRGFHCVIHFDFTISQLAAQLDESGRRGRVLVEGVMNLRQLRVYTYPLRTILVYDFVLTEQDPGLLITKVEEMWSFGDMIENLPLVGRLYDGLFRRFFGAFFTRMFWLSCALFAPGDRRSVDTQSG